MYTIEFGCEDTGEHGYEGVYEKLSDAQCAYDYPGYGYYHIIEISDAKALEIILKEIDERAEFEDHIRETGIRKEYTFNDDGVSMTSKNKVICEYISNKEAGYKLLLDYMMEQFEKEEACLVNIEDIEDVDPKTLFGEM